MNRSVLPSLASQWRKSCLGGRGTSATEGLRQAFQPSFMELNGIYDSARNICQARGRLSPTLHRPLIKLSVGLTCQAYLLETDGLFTQGSRPGRTVGESVGGMLKTDSSDWHWSNGIRYHNIFDTRPDTEFEVEGIGTAHAK